MSSIFYENCSRKGLKFIRAAFDKILPLTGNIFSIKYEAGFI